MVRTIDTTGPSKRTRGRYRKHDGVPRLAAQLCGMSVRMVYKVLNGEQQSPVVERAIEEARRQLRIQRGQAA